MILANLPPPYCYYYFVHVPKVVEAHPHGEKLLRTDDKVYADLLVVVVARDGGGGDNPPPKKK